MNTEQLDLFDALDERRWPADEDHQMPGRGYLRLARIELAEVPGTGWIFATSVNLSDQGYGYALMLKWKRTAADRNEALGKAKAEVIGTMDRYCAGHDDSHHAKAQARQVCKWAESLH
ncbi:hypothetical protein [Stenotrophomonas sp. 278]|uniref:hypothetical protein n=1 Tax=Stenotrophomonas sp. 278 TaxID=2479851 RepID=UPI000F6857F9|nr:hypothetical protein [Stenotrophomonas sp. 278]RRU13196.1 hypothetical protein EGJ34_11515 [Stenotrophomonas sp. 278]